MSSPDVVVEDRSGYGIDVKAVKNAAEKVLAVLGFNRGELGVLFVSVDEMMVLNRKYMGREETTDVISFPLDVPLNVSGENDERAAALESGQAMIPMLLGDVVICPQVAAKQARAAGTTVAEEICLLLIHGILHIAGYDHEKDTGVMEKKQANLVEKICR
jgi:probable rRNA maturation factor